MAETAKLVEIAPQTLTVHGISLTFDRHAAEDGTEGAGTAFMQVIAPKKDPEDLSEPPVGCTVFFNDDGTVHSQVDHAVEPAPPGNGEPVAAAYDDTAELAMADDGGREPEHKKGKKGKYY